MDDQSGMIDTSDLGTAPWRGRFEAWLLDTASEVLHRAYGRRKAAVLGGLSGTVVELGPGTGTNLRYYQAGVRVVAVEPNPAMHQRLRRSARRHLIDLDLRAGPAEQLDLADRSVDAVVSTLVLCSVSDPAKVVAEAHRVLRPGGLFFLLEHVVAPSGSLTRLLQRMAKRPHRWLFNGCEVDRDTAAVLAASPFPEVDLETIDIGLGGLYTRHQIIGTVRRAEPRPG
jgi:ubiquinone/menaquinone biosynthesis C-methylase UbiE